MGDALLAQGLLTREQLTRALEIQQQTGGWLGRILVSMGVLNEHQLAQTLAQQYGLPFLELAPETVDRDTARLIPADLAKRHGVVAARRDNHLVIAMANPLDAEVIDTIRQLTGMDVELVIAGADDIARAQARFYGPEEEMSKASESPDSNGQRPPRTVPAGARTTGSIESHVHLEARPSDALQGEPDKVLAKMERVGNILVEQGVVTGAQLARALEIQRQSGGMLGHILVEMGILTGRELAQAMAQQWGLPYVQLTPETVDREAARLIPTYLARRHGVVVMARKGNTLVVAMPDPSNTSVIDDIRLLTGLEVERAITSPDDIEQFQQEFYGAGELGQQGGQSRVPGAARRAHFAVGPSGPQRRPAQPSATPEIPPRGKSIKAMGRRGRLGDLLVEQGLLTHEQLTQGLEIQRQNGGRLGRILVEMDLLGERDLAQTLAMQWGLPYTELTPESVAPEAAALIPTYLARRHGVIGISLQGNHLVVAMSDPSVGAIDDIRRLLTGMEVELVIAGADDIAEAQAGFPNAGATVQRPEGGTAGPAAGAYAGGAGQAVRKPLSSLGPLPAEAVRRAIDEQGAPDRIDEILPGMGKSETGLPSQNGLSEAEPAPVSIVPVESEPEEAPGAVGAAQGAPAVAAQGAPAVAAQGAPASAALVPTPADRVAAAEPVPTAAAQGAPAVAAQSAPAVAAQSAPAAADQVAAVEPVGQATPAPSVPMPSKPEEAPAAAAQGAPAAADQVAAVEPVGQATPAPSVPMPSKPEEAPAAAAQSAPAVAAQGAPAAAEAGAPSKSKPEKGPEKTRPRPRFSWANLTASLKSKPDKSAVKMAPVETGQAVAESGAELPSGASATGEPEQPPAEVAAAVVKDGISVPESATSVAQEPGAVEVQPPAQAELPAGPSATGEPEQAPAEKMAASTVENPALITEVSPVEPPMQVEISPHASLESGSNTSPGERERIGDLLLAQGLLTQEQLVEALEIQRQRGNRLGRVLIEMSLLDERQIARALAQQWALPYLELTPESVDPEAARLLPVDLAQRHGVVGVSRYGDRLVMAMSDPLNLGVVADVRRLTGLKVEIVIAAADDIARVQAAIYKAAERPDAAPPTHDDGQAVAEKTPAGEPPLETEKPLPAADLPRRAPAKGSPEAPGKRERIGEILLAQGLLTEARLAEALEVQRQSGDQLRHVLVEMGMVTERQVAQATAQQWGWSYVELAPEKVQPEAARAIPSYLAKRYGVAGVTRKGKRLTVAMSDPSTGALEDIRRVLNGFEIDIVIASADDIARAQAGVRTSPRKEQPGAPKAAQPAKEGQKPAASSRSAPAAIGQTGPATKPLQPLPQPAPAPTAPAAGKPTKAAAKVESINNILLAQGAVTQEQMNQALEIQRQSGGRVGRILVQMGVLSERQMAQATAQQWGLPYTELALDAVDPEAVKLIPVYLAQRHGVIAVMKKKNRLTVAMSDPANVVAIDDIRLLTGLDVEIVIASPADITQTQSALYGMDVAEILKDTALGTEADISQQAEAEEITLDKLRTMVEEAPIVRVVSQVISQAVRAGASDIHIEPHRREVKVRFRIDGVLQDIMSPPKVAQAALVSRVKILASMDIAERRLPQDGSAHLRVEGKEYDLRISTMPTVLGEKVVLRILDQSSTKVALHQVGMASDTLALWEDQIAKPYGMIVVTGPTGSGKTTTLYTSLARINTPERNIVSVEDPVEYQMSRVNQVQVNVKAGLTFAKLLRSILRQDPDVVLIGEIRDRETAEIAIQASMTGHLVLSTLHTNDAPGGVTRLQDMGIESFLITSSVLGILAQRLVRIICPHCKEGYTPPVDALQRLGLDPDQHEGVTLYRGKGCDSCRQTGYRGRIGVFELLVLNDRLRALVLSGASADQLREAAQQGGMRTLGQDGIQKVLAGVTTFDELLRVVFVDEKEKQFEEPEEVEEVAEVPEVPEVSEAH